jgi:hypothetical protein
VGISNTSPTERLTVAGNVYVIGSNAVSTGNIWGSTGNIAMRTYTSVTNGENRVENIVGTGKGLKFLCEYHTHNGGTKVDHLGIK